MKELLLFIFGLAVGGFIMTVGLQFNKIDVVFLGFVILGVTMWTGLTKINKIQKLNSLNEDGKLDG